MRAKRWGVVLVAALALALGACAGPARRTARAAYDPSAIPSGPVGASIREGHDIFVATPKLMKAYVRADMSCDACHLAAGTRPRGGTLVGTYARFPQWNKRAKRVITLQDRIAECFLYSMNGRVPPYDSRQMSAIVAYVAWLSRGVPTLSRAPSDQSFSVPLPSGTPDVARGKALYAERCSACHQAGGAGIGGVFPPLWGAKSFNTGAGMAHLNRMVGFVKYNMPKNAPGTLSVRDAFDVAGYVLSHARPKFVGSALQGTSSQPAKFF